MNASSSWVRSCPGTGKPRRQILPLQKQVFIANPVGAAPQTAEPFWCLTASLLISLLPSCLAPPSLLTIASLMLSNCRTYCLCSAAPALGLRGPRKRQATKQGQSTEKGQGWEKKAGTQDRCISAVLRQVCAWLLSP